MPLHDLRSRLLQDVAALGLAIDDAQADTLLGYLAMLAKWNKVYNLTAIREPSQMLTQHVVDSLAVVGPLRREMAGRSVTILDVGSGGGLPGVIIATLFPLWRVTCVDAVAKKASFLQQVALELAVPNLQSLHGRVESLEALQFDIVTSRAFASLIDFAGLTRKLISPAGRWMAMKGHVPTEELRALSCDIEVFHVEHLRVPRLDAERCLVWMRPRGAQSPDPVSF